MKALSRCLSLGCNYKYAWPLWCLLGICCGFGVKIWPQFCICWLSIGLLICLWALVSLSSLRWQIVLASIVVVLNAFFIVYRYDSPERELQSKTWEALAYTYVSGCGKVTKIYVSPWNTKALLRLENGYSLWVESVDKRLRNCKNKTLKFRGLLLPLAIGSDTWKKNDLIYMIKLNDFCDVSASRTYIIPDGSRLRSYIKNRIELAFSPGSREIAMAMFLGCSDYLPKGIKELFRDVGLSHMTAASGFHLSIMAAMAMSLVIWSGRSRKVGAYGAIGLCAIYVWTVGYMASLLRAFIMGTLALGGLVVGRPVRLERTVCLAWSVMLLISPSWIEDIGFQLSFGAIFGILCWTSFLNKIFYFLPNFVKQSVSMTLAVNLFLLPLLISYFQKLPSAFILANLLIVPILEAVFVLIVPALLLSQCPVIGQIIPLVCIYLCRYSLTVAAWLQEKLPVYDFYPLSIRQITLYYFVLIVGRLSLWAFAYKIGEKNFVYDLNNAS